MRHARSLKGEAGAEGLVFVAMLAIVMLSVAALMLLRKSTGGWSVTSKLWTSNKSSLVMHKARIWDARGKAQYAVEASSVARVQLQLQPQANPAASGPTPLSKPAPSAATTAHSKDSSGKDSQPTSGWIRSMRPAQGYELVDSCTASPSAAHFASESCCSSSAMSPLGELQRVESGELLPHPELPRIRVAIGPPLMRQHAQ